MRRILPLFLVLVSVFYFGQEPPSSPLGSAVDSVVMKHRNYSADSLLKLEPVISSEIFPKKFPSELSKKYSGPDFDYSPGKPRRTVFDILIENLKRFLDAVFSQNPQGGSTQMSQLVLRLLGIVLAAFVIYVLVRFFLSGKGNFIFGKKSIPLKNDGADDVQDLNEIDFENEIMRAENDSAFRLAVRYRFLQTLKKLTDRNLILWTPEKTNKDYLFEMQAAPDFAAFRELVHIYDNVWYGEYEVTAEKYGGFKQKFIRFLRS